MSRVPAGGTVTTEPSGAAAVVLDDLLDCVEHGDAVDLAALAPGVTPPTIFVKP